MVLTLGGVPSKYKRATFHLIPTHWALLNLSWVACRAWWDESERERVFSSPFPTPTSPARSVTKRTWDNSAFSLFPRQGNVTSTSLKLLSLTSDPPILTPFFDLSVPSFRCKFYNLSSPCATARLPAVKFSRELQAKGIRGKIVTLNYSCTQ